MNNPAEWEAIHRSRHWGTYPDIYCVRQVKAFMAQWRGDGRPMALDVGCGAGAHTWMMSAEGMDVTAFDVSPMAIERLKKMDFYGIVSDVNEIDFLCTRFDFILDNLTLTHVDSPPWLKIASWLKPGGWLVSASFLTPPKGAPMSWYHQIAGSEFVERQSTTRNGETVEVEVFRYVKP